MAEKPKKDQTPQDPQTEAAAAAEEQHPAFQWAQKHAKPLIAAVSAIILIAAGYAFVDYYQGQQFEKAKVELSTILSEPDGQERAQQLETFAEESPDELTMSALLELAKTYEAEGKFEQAADTWGKIAAQADDQFSIPARLGKANALASAGLVEKALAELESLNNAAPESYSQVIKFQIASTAEKAGDYERALQAYQAVQKDEQTGQQAFVQYKIRQFERKLEKRDSAS